MKKQIVALLTIIFFVSLVPQVDARSGCCSYHGGVRADGCGCNDGSPLSSTCAPYYTCSAAPQATTQPVYIPPTSTPIPFPTNTPVPTATPTPQPTNTPTPTLQPSPTKKLQQTVLGKKTTKKHPKPKPTPTPHRNWWERLLGR